LAKKLDNLEMDMIRFKRKNVFIAALIVVAIGIGGCANSRESKNSAFDQWKEMAEKSRGYSPRARKRTVDIPAKDIKVIAPHLADQHPPRPLPTRKITMKMHQTDVAVLLRALARAVNLNIMINESVSGRISINVIDAKWDQVFMGILNSQGLAYEWQGDIIRIITYEDRDRNFRNLEADGKILAKKREMEMQAPLVTKIIPIDFANAERLKQSVEKVLSSKKPGEPVGSIVVDTHTNALIVQATPSDIERIVPLVVELDRPTRQILIEAHIVETTNRTARELGVQWGGLLVNADEDLWLAPDAIGASEIQPGSGDVVNPLGGSVSNFPANLGNAAQAGTGFSLGFISQGSRGLLSLQLTALEEQGELNILSSPSITTLDNIKATIESGDQVPIPIVENENVEVIYKSALLSLEVTPHVIQDDVLKLEIVTTKDELDFARSVSLYPTITTKKASTNVILFDGQTTVIGGLKKNTDSDSEAGIPWLSKIPLLGYLFRNDSKRYEMEEILIFITPHILKTQPVAETVE
jgi:type IV pilus assembly protein PilQ